MTHRKMYRPTSECRTRIREQLESKLRDLNAFRANRAHLMAEPATDALDQGQSEMSVDLAVRAINVDWQTARAIRAALERIHTDEYGTCEACGDPIAARRLSVIPWAARCAPCQSVHEAAQDANAVFQNAG